MICKDYVLYWHGDNFDLPEGCKRRAGHEHYPNQAFSYGKDVLALPFNPELLSAQFESWSIDHVVEIKSAGLLVTQLTQDIHRFGLGLERTTQEMCADYLARVN